MTTRSLHKTGRLDKLDVFPVAVPKGYRYAFDVKEPLMGRCHVKIHTVLVKEVEVWHPRKKCKVRILRFECSCEGSKFHKLCRHVKKLIRMVMPGASLWQHKVDALRQHRKMYTIQIGKKWYWLTDRSRERRSWCGWTSKKREVVK